jgi:hypothetical protein
LRWSSAPKLPPRRPEPCNMDAFDLRHVIALCYAAPMVLVDPRRRRGSSRRESQMGLIDWYLSLGEYWYLSFLIISGNRVTQRPASFFVKELFKMGRRDKRFSLLYRTARYK